MRGSSPYHDYITFTNAFTKLGGGGKEDWEVRIL